MVNGSLAVTPSGNLVSDDRQAHTISGLVSISVSVVENASPLLLQCINYIYVPFNFALILANMSACCDLSLSVFAVRHSDNNFQLLQITLGT